MPYVVTDACIKFKHTDCVEVCPVDCFDEGENMVVVYPDECIDCGACGPECPVNAIEPDHAGAGPGWAQHNKRLAAKWPVITKRKTHAPDAYTLKSIPSKFAQFFDPHPGRPCLLQRLAPASIVSFAASLGAMRLS